MGVPAHHRRAIVADRPSRHAIALDLVELVSSTARRDAGGPDDPLASCLSCLLVHADTMAFVYLLFALGAIGGRRVALVADQVSRPTTWS
jgi:hypothetical protein